MTEPNEPQVQSDLQSLLNQIPEVEIPPQQQKTRGRPRKNQTDDQTIPTGFSKSAAGNKKLAGELALIKTTFDSFFVGTGTLLKAADQFDGTTVIYGGPLVSQEIVNTAANDARFREYILNFCRANTYVNLITAFMGLLLPIAAHHGLAPYMFVYSAPEQAVEIEMKMQEKWVQKNGAKV